MYQTLADKGNPDHVEANGPFICRIKTAWLGEGYYFWDSHVELGHWWGRVAYGEEYIICKAAGILDESCWDLHGNGMHRLEFFQACEEIIRKKLSTRENLLVPQVISWLVKRGTFPFTAIRALAMESIRYNLNDTFVVLRTRFHRSNRSFLDLSPPVQLCLLNKKALSLSGYSIVHPEHYVDYDFA